MIVPILENRLRFITSYIHLSGCCSVTNIFVHKVVYWIQNETKFWINILFMLFVVTCNFVCNGNLFHHFCLSNTIILILKFQEIKRLSTITKNQHDFLRVNVPCNCMSLLYNNVFICVDVYKWRGYVYVGLEIYILVCNELSHTI